MIAKLIKSACVLVAVTLGCMLLSALLKDIDITAIALIAVFLGTWAGVIGLISGLWYYFSRA